MQTISRAGSRKSRTSRQETAGVKVQGHSSDSESDADDNMKKRGSDLDLMVVDISNEKDWDTDLEMEGKMDTMTLKQN